MAQRRQPATHTTPPFKEFLRHHHNNTLMQPATTTTDPHLIDKPNGVKLQALHSASLARSISTGG